MHYGYRIIEDMQDGLWRGCAARTFESLDDFRGLTLSKVKEWKLLNLNYKIVAKIREDLCIGWRPVPYSMLGRCINAFTLIALCLSPILRVLLTDYRGEPAHH